MKGGWNERVTSRQINKQKDETLRMRKVENAADDGGRGPEKKDQRGGRGASGKMKNRGK